MTWVVLPNIKRVKIMNEQNQSILSFSHIVFDELSFKRIGFRQPDEQEIQTTKQNMRLADPMMYETYDNYLLHLWDKADIL